MKLSLITLLLAFLPHSLFTQDNQIKSEAAVWAAVETRNATWATNDQDGHLAIYHPNFLRWALNSDLLLTKDSFASLWDAIKSNETVVELKVIPKEVRFYANDAVAIAHYTIDEKYQWIGENTNTRKKGDLFSGNLRFSDVYIFEGNRWLYAGGHRDGMALPPPRSDSE